MAKIQAIYISPANLKLKPYIQGLTSNTLREIISYLTYTDFLEFCICCKKFLRFLTDKFIAYKPAIPTIFPASPSPLEPILEEKLIKMLQIAYYPSVNVVWKPFSLFCFHFAVYDSRRFFFAFHHRIFEIKEASSFSAGFSPIFSYEFHEQVESAVGYKNKVLFLLKNTIVSMKLDHESEILNTSASNPEIYTFSKAKIEEKVKKIEFFNNGKNVLIAFKYSIYLMNDKLRLLNVHKINEKFKMHIPSKEGKSYISLAKHEIRIFRLNNSQDTRFSVQREILHFGTTYFNKAPQLVYSNDYAEVFINRAKTSITCNSHFLLLGQCIIYYFQRMIYVHDLVTQSIKYTVQVPHSTEAQLIDVSTYRILYRIGQKIYIHSLIISSGYSIEPFCEEIDKIKVYNNIIIVNCRSQAISGVVVMDLFRQRPIEGFLRNVRLPEELEL